MKKQIIITALLLSSVMTKAQFRRHVGCPYQQRLSKGIERKPIENKFAKCVMALIVVGGTLLTTIKKS
jgi:hypothetical protein